MWSGRSRGNPRQARLTGAHPTLEDRGWPGRRGDAVRVRDGGADRMRNCAGWAWRSGDTAGRALPRWWREDIRIEDHPARRTDRRSGRTGRGCRGCGRGPGGHQRRGARCRLRLSHRRDVGLRGSSGPGCSSDRGSCDRRRGWEPSGGRRRTRSGHRAHRPERRARRIAGRSHGEFAGSSTRRSWRRRHPRIAHRPRSRRGGSRSRRSHPECRIGRRPRSARRRGDGPTGSSGGQHLPEPRHLGGRGGSRRDRGAGSVGRRAGCGGRGRARGARRRGPAGRCGGRGDGAQGLRDAPSKLRIRRIGIGGAHRRIAAQGEVDARLDRPRRRGRCRGGRIGRTPPVQVQLATEQLWRGGRQRVGSFAGRAVALRRQLRAALQTPGHGGG